LWIATRFGSEDLRRVIIQPEALDERWIAREDDDWSVGDAPHFGESLFEVGPLVHSERCHTCVKPSVAEREFLGDGINRHAHVRRSLRAPRRGWLDGGDVAIIRLVRAGACTDVQDGLRCAGASWMRAMMRGSGWR
jgi:hypothetical protein